MAGALISPEDWEALELTRGTDGHYIWTNVNSGGETRLWRVPVVVSNALTGNDFLVGDFTQAASLYTREGFSVRISESLNLFVENGIAILGEERAAFGIEFPWNICKVNLLRRLNLFSRGFGLCFYEGLTMYITKH